ncbi:Ras GTPase-activating protein 1 [Balamuthia mandrillaris]
MDQNSPPSHNEKEKKRTRKNKLLRSLSASSGGAVSKDLERSSNHHDKRSPKQQLGQPPIDDRMLLEDKERLRKADSADDVRAMRRRRRSSSLGHHKGKVKEDILSSSLQQQVHINDNFLSNSNDGIDNSERGRDKTKKSNNGTRNERKSRSKTRRSSSLPSSGTNVKKQGRLFRSKSQPKHRRKKTEGRADSSSLGRRSRSLSDSPRSFNARASSISPGRGSSSESSSLTSSFVAPSSSNSRERDVFPKRRSNSSGGSSSTTPRVDDGRRHFVSSSPIEVPFPGVPFYTDQMSPPRSHHQRIFYFEGGGNNSSRKSSASSFSPRSESGSSPASASAALSSSSTGWTTGEWQPAVVNRSSSVNGSGKARSPQNQRQDSFSTMLNTSKILEMQWIVSRRKKEKFLALFKKALSQRDTTPSTVTTITDEQARKIFTTSALPSEQLDHIYHMSKSTSSPSCSSEWTEAEFIVAMFLISMALKGRSLPSKVPSGLRRSSQSHHDDVDMANMISPSSSSSSPNNNSNTRRRRYTGGLELVASHRSIFHHSKENVLEEGREGREGGDKQQTTSRKRRNEESPSSSPFTPRRETTPAWHGRDIHTKVSFQLDALLPATRASNLSLNTPKDQNEKEKEREDDAQRDEWEWTTKNRSVSWMESQKVELFLANALKGINEEEEAIPTTGRYHRSSTRLRTRTSGASVIARFGDSKRNIREGGESVSSSGGTSSLSSSAASSLSSSLEATELVRKPSVKQLSALLEAQEKEAEIEEAKGGEEAEEEREARYLAWLEIELFNERMSLLEKGESIEEHGDENGTSYPDFVPLEEARAIFRRYFDVNSPFKVSSFHRSTVASLERELFHKYSSSPAKVMASIFESAQNELLTSLRKDGFPKLLRGFITVVTQSFPTRLPRLVFEEMYRELATEERVRRYNINHTSLAPSPNMQNWELLEEVEGIRCLRKVFPGSSLSCAACMGVVPAPAAQLSRLLQGMGAVRRDWDELYLEGRVMERFEEEMQLLSFSMRNISTSVKKREFVTLRTCDHFVPFASATSSQQHSAQLSPAASSAAAASTASAADTYFLIESSVSHSSIPPRPHHIRGEVEAMGWVIKPTGKNTSLVTRLVQIDWKGKIPIAVANSLNLRLAANLLSLKQHLVERIRDRSLELMAAHPASSLFVPFIARVYYPHEDFASAPEETAAGGIASSPALSSSSSGLSTSPRTYQSWMEEAEGDGVSCSPVLNMQEDDELIVVKRSPVAESRWWLGFHNGKLGLFHIDYIIAASNNKRDAPLGGSSASPGSWLGENSMFASDPTNLLMNPTMMSLLHILLGSDLSLVFALLSSTELSSIQTVAEAVITIFEAAGDAATLIKAAITKDLSEQQNLRKSNSATLFRGTETHTVLLAAYNKTVGKKFLVTTLKKPIAEVVQLYHNNESLEVDPKRVPAHTSFGENMRNLVQFSRMFVDQILASISYCPGALRDICRHLRQEVEAKFPESKDSVVAGFFFLRFLCPAIVSPVDSGIAKEESITVEVRRGLVLISKVVQNLANGVEFGNKEPHMLLLNQFINEKMTAVREFFDKLTDPKEISIVLSREGERQKEKFTVRLPQDAIQTIHWQLVAHLDSIALHLQRQQRQKRQQKTEQLKDEDVLIKEDEGTILYARLLEIMAALGPPSVPSSSSLQSNSRPKKKKLRLNLGKRMSLMASSAAMREKLSKFGSNINSNETTTRESSLLEERISALPSIEDIVNEYSLLSEDEEVPAIYVLGEPNNTTTTTTATTSFRLQPQTREGGGRIIPSSLSIAASLTKTATNETGRAEGEKGMAMGMNTTTNNKAGLSRKPIGIALNSGGGVSGGGAGALGLKDIPISAPSPLSPRGSNPNPHPKSSPRSIRALWAKPTSAASSLSSSTGAAGENLESASTIASAHTVPLTTTVSATIAHRSPLSSASTVCRKTSPRSTSKRDEIINGNTPLSSSSPQQDLHSEEQEAFKKETTAQKKFKTALTARLNEPQTKQHLETVLRDAFFVAPLSFLSEQQHDAHAVDSSSPTSSSTSSSPSSVTSSASWRKSIHALSTLSQRNRFVVPQITNIHVELINADTTNKEQVEEQEAEEKETQALPTISWTMKGSAVLLKDDNKLELGEAGNIVIGRGRKTEQNVDGVDDGEGRYSCRDRAKSELVKPSPSWEQRVDAAREVFDTSAASVPPSSDLVLVREQMEAIWREKIAIEKQLLQSYAQHQTYMKAKQDENEAGLAHFMAQLAAWQMQTARLEQVKAAHGIRFEEEMEESLDKGAGEGGRGDEKEEDELKGEQGEQGEQEQEEQEEPTLRTQQENAESPIIVEDETWKKRNMNLDKDKSLSSEERRPNDLEMAQTTESSPPQPRRHRCHHRRHRHRRKRDSKSNASSLSSSSSHDKEEHEEEDIGTSEDGTPVTVRKRSKSLDRSPSENIDGSRRRKKGEREDNGSKRHSSSKSTRREDSLTRRVKRETEKRRKLLQLVEGESMKARSLPSQAERLVQSSPGCSRVRLSSCPDQEEQEDKDKEEKNV